ncbi:hypothetical protein AB6A40_010492 [Gnathostoma spinigerum]|uniref:Uncharacterized protein n=1 Tax=Gnathostoma spinigerum TaxID=75299 RepID=A0ABD6EV05_9BILA
MNSRTCPKLELDQLVTVRVQSDSTAASLRLVWLKSIVGPPVREDSILKVQRKRGLSSTSECSTDLPIKKPVSASSLTEQPEKALPVLKEVKVRFMIFVSS